VSEGIQIDQDVLRLVSERLRVASDGVQPVRLGAEGFGDGVVVSAAERCGARLDAAAVGLSESVSDAGSGAGSTQVEFGELDRRLGVKVGWRG